MIEGTSGACLLLETANSFGIVRKRPRQDLDGDFTAEPVILGPIDFSHPALTEEGLNLVRTNLASQPCLSSA